MKFNTIVIGLSAFSLSAFAHINYEQASRLIPRLAPRIAGYQAPSKDLIPGNDKNFTHDELFALQKRFLDNFVAPKNAIQAKAINSSLLAEDVQGRVDITRTFNGRELNTEYLFGLFANLANSAYDDPTAFSLLGIPTAYEITHFAASQNIAAASTRFQFFFQAINATLPIQIQTWNVFNAAGEISMYDATFTGWWQWAVDILLQTASKELSFAENKLVSLADTQTYVQRKLATSICGTAQKYCVGPLLQQYQNATACYEFLTTETRFGEAHELGQNTLLCRMVHQNMVPLRPAVHCPHIGPSGGGYCIDTPSYADTVRADYFSNYKFAYGNGSLSG